MWAVHSIGRVGVSISARVGSQHSAEHAAGRAAKAKESASSPTIFSKFYKSASIHPAAPKAPQARSRRPSAGTARYPPAEPVLAKGLAGIGRPGPERARRRGRSGPPTPRPCQYSERKGVQDRGGVAGGVDFHHADEVPRIEMYSQFCAKNLFSFLGVRQF